MYDSEKQATANSLCLVYIMKYIRLTLFQIQKQFDISRHFIYDSAVEMYLQ
jgi:hypothetical protein